MRQFAGSLFAIGVVATLAPAPIAAQSKSEGEVEKKLAYVASVAPERTYFCRVTPRGSGTSQTQMRIEFTLEGVGPVDAQMVVSGLVSDRRYSARLSWRGTASRSSEDSEIAVITLDEVYKFDADPLPGDAAWSDPSGDTITLHVEEYVSMGPEPYILVGTQTSEFGINDLRCVDGRKI